MTRLMRLALPALGASNTPGNSGAYLVMQNDGNLMAYSASGAVLWASNTGGH